MSNNNSIFPTIHVVVLPSYHRNIPSIIYYFFIKSVGLYYKYYMMHLFFAAILNIITDALCHVLLKF